MIALNQDRLGVQAKRVFTTFECKNADKEYIQDNERVDVLVKPLFDSSIAVSVINLSETKNAEKMELKISELIKKIDKVSDDLKKATHFKTVDLWSGEEKEIDSLLEIPTILPCDNVTLKIVPKCD